MDGCQVRVCEGFRMPAHDDGATHSGAGVRKPPREESAGGRARWCVTRYGDLTAAVPECEYNFCDMARTLRMGENTFAKQTSRMRASTSEKDPHRKSPLPMKLRCHVAKYWIAK